MFEDHCYPRIISNDLFVFEKINFTRSSASWSAVWASSYFPCAIWQTACPFKRSGVTVCLSPNSWNI